MHLRRAAIMLTACLLPGSYVAAQTCAQEGAAATSCHVLLSRPARVMITARTQLVGPVRGRAALVLAVDGADCVGRPAASSFWSNRRVGVRCRVLLASGTHVLHASLDRADLEAEPIEVVISDDRRLAAIPYEASTLYPPAKTPAPPRRLWSFSQ